MQVALQMTTVLQKGHSSHPFSSWKTLLENTEANRESLSLHYTSSSQEWNEEMLDSVFGPTRPPSTNLKWTASLQDTPCHNGKCLPETHCPWETWVSPKSDGLSVHCSQISPFPSLLPIWFRKLCECSAVDVNPPFPVSPTSCSLSHLPPRCRAPSPLSPQQSECSQHTPGVHCSHFWWHPASGGWTSPRPTRTPHWCARSPRQWEPRSW